MPSGPTGSAHARRFERLQSGAMSNAVSYWANGSATIRLTGDLASIPVGRRQCDLAGCTAGGEEVVEVGEVEVDRVDVYVAAAFHAELVPAVGRDVIELGVPCARTVGRHADQFFSGDKHRPVG
jgi:hypothetical protein